MAVFPRKRSVCRPPFGARAAKNKLRSPIYIRGGAPTNQAREKEVPFVNGGAAARMVKDEGRKSRAFLTPRVSQQNNAPEKNSGKSREHGAEKETVA